MVKKLTLLELNKSIQEKVNSNFPNALWVIAEISELKLNKNGHCYLELVEKDIITDNIITKSRATIWAFTFRMLRPYFESTTGYELKSGIKILVQVNVEFHELYGLSLNISDIDPNYTLGDLAQKKAETLNKLESEGVINMNKEIPFPIVPQKIAVISSYSAAGYQDFIKQLENNNSGYKFYTKLFPSVMQGLQAEESIINSLENIYNYEDFFDIVVIIRGGGSQADLSCFNNYLIAANIAQFPIPVLTGIGHDKDESIADIVAHKKLKTPTAVSEYIIEKTSVFEDKLYSLKDNILGIVSDYVQDQKTILTHFAAITVPSARNNLDKSNYQLNIIIEKFKNNIKNYSQEKINYLVKLSNSVEKNSTKTIFNQFETLNSIENTLRFISFQYVQKQYLTIDNLLTKTTLLNPENILKRGYSITYLKGEKLNNLTKINENDEIITKLYSGFIRSTVKEKIEKKE